MVKRFQSPFTADDIIVIKTPKLGFKRLGKINFLDLMDYKFGKMKHKDLPVEGYKFNLDWARLPTSTNRFPAKIGLVKVNYYETGMGINGDSDFSCNHLTHS